MTQAPRVSIVIPNYNHGNFLNLRLDTLFSQTFQDFEVILLDDASSDNSSHILRDYSNNPKVSHLLINKRNSGSPFKQWKKGIDLAKGEFIWIAESDDYCDIYFLERIFQFFHNSEKNVGLAYTQSIDVDENDRTINNRVQWTQEFKPNIWKENFSISGEDFIRKYLKVKNVIPNASAVVFKKDLVDEHTFSRSLLEMEMCGDWFFWIQISFKTRVGFIAEPLNFFREHSTMSRFHNARKKKINRHLEEAELRRFLQKNFLIEQKKEVWSLYSSWYDLFLINAIGMKTFYNILVKKSHFPMFVRNFILNKYL